MQIYSIDGITPVVHPSAFVHPSAVIIGDVIIGPGCYVGPAASLRGDFGRIVLEQGANVQDTCVMHGFPRGDTVIEQDGHVSHGAVLHGCRVGRNAMVGINAVIMDEASIGRECLVGALAYVKPGFEGPPRSVILGSPARVLREVTDADIDWKTRATGLYKSLTRRCQASLRAVSPLAAVEPDRPRIRAPEMAPLHRTRGRP